MLGAGSVDSSDKCGIIRAGFCTSCVQPDGRNETQNRTLGDEDGVGNYERRIKAAIFLANGQSRPKISVSDLRTEYQVCLRYKEDEEWLRLSDNYDRGQDGRVLKKW